MYVCMYVCILVCMYDVCHVCMRCTKCWPWCIYLHHMCEPGTPTHQQLSVSAKTMCASVGRHGGSSDGRHGGSSDGNVFLQCFAWNDVGRLHTSSVDVAWILQCFAWNDVGRLVGRCSKLSPFGGGCSNLFQARGGDLKSLVYTGNDLCNFCTLHLHSWHIHTAVRHILWHTRSCIPISAYFYILNIFIKYVSVM